MSDIPSVALFYKDSLKLRWYTLDTVGFALRDVADGTPLRRLAGSPDCERPQQHPRDGAAPCLDAVPALPGQAVRRVYRLAVCHQQPQPPEPHAGVAVNPIDILQTFVVCWF